MALCDAGYPVTLTTVSAYAGELAAGVTVRVGALDAPMLGELLTTVEVVIDATHPFATEISRLAIARCQQHGVPYLRYERPNARLGEGIIAVENAEEAAAEAVRMAHGGVIFLTVGSKTLGTYLAEARAAGCRLVARVLPTVQVLLECESLGLNPCDIIAMQGPTSAELDAALIRHLGAAVIVSKESGDVGGVQEKIRAAELAGIPMIIVRRPVIAYPCAVQTIDELLAFLHESGAHDRDEEREV